MLWSTKESYIIGVHQEKLFKLKKKLAMFDLDNTLINTKKGHIVSIDEDDWDYAYKQVKNKLEEYYKNNYSIIIITNQKVITFDEDNTSKNKIYINKWKNKINNFAKSLNLPFIILASLESDMYRKPSLGLYNIILNNLTRKKIKLDKNNSFYSGDAVGRKHDFSDSDIKFALNIKIKFYLPEYIFNNKENILPEIKPLELIQEENKINYNNLEDFVILCGLPASGKTTLAKELEKNNYKIINQDSLKTKEKCLETCKNLAINKNKIIIDNTNMSREERNNYISIAKKYNYKITCIVFKTSIKQCMHNSYYRNYITNNKIKPIPLVAYRMLNNKYQKPELTENINNIIELEQNIINDERYYLYYE
jgi:bifunctional polynucleotide phosphatase/kinase